MTTTQENKQTIYINMAFDQIASDVNGKNTQLVPTYNGKGRRLIKFLQSQEHTYLYYSSDEAGEKRVQPPLAVNDGDVIEFILQAQATDSDTAKYKVKDINQSFDDLRLIKGTESTYNVQIPPNLPRAEDDAVFITIHFKLKNKEGDMEKFAITWDPAVRVKV